MVGRQFPRPRSRRGGEREQLLHAARCWSGPAQPAAGGWTFPAWPPAIFPGAAYCRSVCLTSGAAAADARRPRPHELRELTPLAEVSRQRLGAERRRVEDARAPA